MTSAELLGDLEQVSAPSGAILTPGEAADWVRQERGLDDGQLALLLERATVYCENLSPGQRQLRRATWDLPVRWWWDDELRIPRPPLVSVGSVQYYATDGTLTTLATSQYLVATPWRMPGRIERAPLVIWPPLEVDRQWPIRIRFVAGYGEGAVPETIKQAILFVVAQWYQGRSPLGQLTEEAKNTVCDLLQSEGWGSYA